MFDRRRRRARGETGRGDHRDLVAAIATAKLRQLPDNWRLIVSVAGNCAQFTEEPIPTPADEEEGMGTGGSWVG